MGGGELMVTLEEAKRHLRVLHDDDDAEIVAMIEAATDHLRSIDVDVAVAPPPPALRHATLLIVGTWFDHRADAADPALRPVPHGVSALVAPYRRVCM